MYAIVDALEGFDHELDCVADRILLGDINTDSYRSKSRIRSHGSNFDNRLLSSLYIEIRYNDTRSALFSERDAAGLANSTP